MHIYNYRKREGGRERLEAIKKQTQRESGRESIKKQKHKERERGGER
jgi:hypothetical protein